MLVLIGLSAFFSASEAALFSLRAIDRREMKESSRSTERLASVLLRTPDRLLTAVLFWNLTTNILYFTLADLTSLRLLHKNNGNNAIAVAIPFVSLLLIIFFSEMLPKSLAVLRARRISAWVSSPLSVAISMVDPIMPYLRNITLVSQRIVWPGFQPEPYLEAADLARAIEISKTNQQLIEQEQKILQNIVSLSDLGVEECMRPRTQLLTFRPPVSFSDIRQESPPSGYLFITELDSDEIAKSVSLDKLTDSRSSHLEYWAEPVLFVPWCITAADALQKLHAKERETAVVVNELGETIGVITRRDILDVIFSRRSSRSERLLNREPIRQLDAERWEVTGIANVSFLEDYFRCEIPQARNVTVAGVIQETLQRLPEIGDRCVWGPFEFEVSDTIGDDQILVVVRRTEQEEDE